MRKGKENSVIGTNRKARFNYSVQEVLECGIVLTGTEVKSVKNSTLNFTDSYCDISKGQLTLKKLMIPTYDHGRDNHIPERSRKLLAHKKEISRLNRQVMEKGVTLIPLKFYLKNGLVKVEVGLCKGKKLYDKRHALKEKDVKRKLQRGCKGFD